MEHILKYIWSNLNMTYIAYIFHGTYIKIYFIKFKYGLHIPWNICSCKSCKPYSNWIKYIWIHLYIYSNIFYLIWIMQNRKNIFFSIHIEREKIRHKLVREKANIFGIYIIYILYIFEYIRKTIRYGAFLPNKVQFEVFREGKSFGNFPSALSSRETGISRHNEGPHPSIS